MLNVAQHPAVDSRILYTGVVHKTATGSGRRTMAAGAVGLHQRRNATAVGKIIRIAGGIASTAIYGTGLYPPFYFIQLCAVER